MLNGFMPSIMGLLKSLLLKTCIQMLPPCIGGVSTLLLTVNIEFMWRDLETGIKRDLV